MASTEPLLMDSLLEQFTSSNTNIHCNYEVLFRTRTRLSGRLSPRGSCTSGICRSRTCRPVGGGERSGLAVWSIRLAPWVRGIDWIRTFKSHLDRVHYHLAR
jgi:hypothetical protein